MLGRKTLPKIKTILKEKYKPYFEDPMVVINVAQDPYIGAKLGYVSIIGIGSRRLELKGDESLVDILAQGRSINNTAAWETIAVYKRPRSDEDKSRGMRRFVAGLSCLPSGRNR